MHYKYSNINPVIFYFLKNFTLIQGIYIYIYKSDPWQNFLDMTRGRSTTTNKHIPSLDGSSKWYIHPLFGQLPSYKMGHF